MLGSPRDARSYTLDLTLNISHDEWYQKEEEQLLRTILGIHLIVLPVEIQNMFRI